MTNRASIVRSLTPRALNANARSFGSSFGSRAAAGHAPGSDATPVAAKVRHRTRDASVVRFGTDPVDITFEAMINGDRKDLRKFVGVARHDRRLDRRIALGTRLDQHRNFLRSF